MGSERKKMRFEIFFSRFFTNLPKILLTDLLFAIPSLLFIFGFYFLNRMLFNGGISVLFSLIVIIPIFPFYSGVVQVVRNIARGDSDVKVIPCFFNALKSNFLLFLLHGVVECAIAVMSYLAISFYINMLSQHPIMYVLLFFCIIIVMLLLYASWYICLLSVTYDLPIRYLYKNSFLMSFGELKNNMIGVFAFIVAFAVFFTFVIFAQSPLLLIIVLSALWALLVPATLTFCYVFFIYDGMVDILQSKQDLEAEKAIEKGAQPQPNPVAETITDFSDVDISKLRDTDDFIYFNGKMMKQSTVLRLAKEQQNKQTSSEEDNDE